MHHGIGGGRLLFLVERPLGLGERGALGIHGGFGGANGIIAAAELGGGEVGGELIHLRLVGGALRAGLVELLLGDDLGAGQVFPAGEFGRGKFQVRLGTGELRGEGIDLGGTFAFQQVVELGLRLREVVFRLGDGGGFRLVFEGEERLPRLHRIAAGHGELRKGTAERGADIDIFALDVALEPVGIARPATRQQHRCECQQTDAKHQTEKQKGFHG